MPPSLHPEIGLIPGTFSLYIAPAEFIHEALSTLLTRHRGKVLYLCGNYPVILPGLQSLPASMLVRRALTVYQILTILEEAQEPLIIFEHDRTLYDDNADLLPYLGEISRQKATENGMVCLLAYHLDKWLIRIEPYTNRVIYISERSPQVQKMTSISPAQQQTLDGLW